MSGNHSDFTMLIESVFEIPDRGVAFVGVVLSGIIHKGDKVKLIDIQDHEIISSVVTAISPYADLTGKVNHNLLFSDLNIDAVKSTKKITA
jgi:translation elongation factor EF-Tu-like GTPase